LGLGCGRFNYSAATRDGTRQFLVNSSAFFIEPMANVGYEFLGRFFVQLEGTYLLRILAGNESVGMGKLPNAFPNGPLLSGSIGYRFPLL
jgi:hypothetical protein